MNLLWKMTGGRPMQQLEHILVDRVTGQDVRHYRDRLGRDWLATGAWSLFRVEWVRAAHAGVGATDEASFCHQTPIPGKEEQ